MRRIKKLPSTVSLLYYRGERSVKLNRKSCGNMMTLEKAIALINKRREKQNVR